MNLRNCISIIAIAVTAACTPPANETVYTYNSNENFRLNIYHAEVEFIKDNVEYIKLIGNYSNPQQLINITERPANYDYPFPYLQVRGGDMGLQDLQKVEIHYINFRRLLTPYFPPTNLGTSEGSTIYTREAIVEDSIDLSLYLWQDSVIEVNTQSLKLFGGDLARSSLKGFAHHAEMNFDLRQDCVTQHTLYRYAQLITDSMYLHLYPGYLACTTSDFQTKIYIHANDFLEIDAGGIAGGLYGTSYDCPTCLCEIYYTGYPTILNHDSLNPKVVIIDNN